MSDAESAKKLLVKYLKQKYKTFIQNDEPSLTVPTSSYAPGVSASRRVDVYEKITSHPSNQSHIKHISKNGNPHSFVWQTQPDKLKKAVRWGIIPAHSITGKVIGSLGRYRMNAYSGIAKGMVSNSHSVKIKLLDLYQDRFEALQSIESMVNKPNSQVDFERVFNTYIQDLEQLQTTIDNLFAEDLDEAGLTQQTLEQLKEDLSNDIARALEYKNSIPKEGSLKSYNQARGTKSVLEFVKTQMLQNLHEFEGINQDNSFSLDRNVVMTRGRMNDYIVDAMFQINENKADFCNAVTDKHHGLFSQDPNQPVCYDFEELQHSPQRDYEIKLAISFIEGWDKLEKVNKKYYVSNSSGREKLDTITATRWQTHRTIGVFFKSMGYYFYNIIKGIFVPTLPWDEETWENEDFHLTAHGLNQYARGGEPLRLVLYRYLKQIAYIFIDFFTGIYDFGTELVWKLPKHITDDWESVKPLATLDDIYKEANYEISQISQQEQSTLAEVFKECQYKDVKYPDPKSILASIEYELSSGEENDILTALARGLNEFGSTFTHNFYAKDPIAGLIFTSSLALGFGAVYLPSSTAAVFGSNYVNWFNNTAVNFGSTKLTCAFSAASSQSQLIATTLDIGMHGANSGSIGALHQVGEKPATVATFLATTYGIGYLLANGIAGYTIPWLSDFLKSDLGAYPDAFYPLVGTKVSILVYEALTTHKYQPFSKPALSKNSHPVSGVDPVQLKRFNFAIWLSQNASFLPQLDAKLQLNISRQIDSLYTKEQAKSLKKILYPEPHHSIAYQLIFIPLSYIPATLRFLSVLVLSMYSLVTGQANPFAPIERAGSEFVDKIKKDLSRLLVAITTLLYFPYNLITSLFKAIAYVFTMLIGRVAALIGEKPAHALHKAMAAVAVFFRSIGEALYPFDIVKDSALLNPHILLKK